MNAFWGVITAVVVALTVAAAKDLVSQEVRGRLDRLPKALLRLAARRVSDDNLSADLLDDLREDLLAEWQGELDVILHEAGALPITRLCQGLRYSIGIVRTAPTIADTLLSSPAGETSQRSKRSRVRAVARVSGYVVVSLVAALYGLYLLMAAVAAVVADDPDAPRVAFPVLVCAFCVSLGVFVFTTSDDRAGIAGWIATAAITSTLVVLFFSISNEPLYVYAVFLGVAALGGAAVACVARLARSTVKARRW